MTITDDWYGLYRAGWKNMIVDDAFQHPAKFARNLIKQIYDHCLVCHWLEAGDTVVDPFGGVALGGLDAMRLGLNWIGIELEPKFVDLGNRNIALWNQRYGDKFMRWGTAHLLQGDSRQLLEVVAGADACVSSPPYAASMEKRGGIDPEKSNHVGGPHSQMNNSNTRYGQTAGQLAALREGDLDAAISSPPYAGSATAKNSAGIDKRKQWETYRAQGGGMSFDAFIAQQERHSADYGDSDGQLAQMREGNIDAAISSPPFGEGETRNRNSYQGGYVADMMSRAYTQDRQGDTPGNLAALRADDDGFAAAVSSPPYEGIRQDGGRIAKEGMGGFGAYTDEPPDYWHTQRDQNNIGNLKTGETFWESARVIVAQTFAALRPGGHAVWTLKAFVRDGKRVEFPDQWRQLCESVGFVTLHVHRAWLVEDHGIQPGFAHTDNGDGTITPQYKRLRKERKSFFRRLAESKGSPRIDYETIVCMEKPGA